MGEGFNAGQRYPVLPRGPRGRRHQRAVWCIAGLSRADLRPAKAEPKPPKMGSVNRPTTGAPPQPICDRAREARARNSPVATNLEAQCRAAQQRALLMAAGTARETPPVKPGGAGPTITADSNPVMVPNGQDSGTTT